MTDKQGAVCWAHPANPDRPAPTPTFEPETGPAKACDDHLDRVYLELQTQFTLDQAHKQQLLDRGLTEIAIRHHGLRSVHPAASIRATIAQSVAERYPYWQGVPGFFLNSKPKIAAAQGLAIFGRNLAGQCVAVQVRRDKVDPGSPRYYWLSSNKYGGPSSGAPATFWKPVSMPQVEGVIRICEGSLKALVAAEKTGIAGIAAGAGVGSMASEQILGMLSELNPSRVLFAPDADALTAPEVSSRVQVCLGRLLWLRQSMGFELLVETWDPSAKGIDDALQAGLTISTADPEAYRRSLPFDEGSSLGAEEAEVVDSPEHEITELAQGWPQPEPFQITDEGMASAPLWALPQTFRSLVDTVAAAKQITQGSVLASMLGVESSICAGRYCTYLAPQYTTHCHVWILLALRSSGGKSEALQVFQRDVYRGQKRLQQETQEQNDRNALERATLVKQILAMESGSAEDYPGQLSESRERLRLVAEKPLPRFIWKDVSPQKLDVLYSKYQRVGIVTPESADWISLIMGYGKDSGPVLGSSLSGFSVEPHGSDRITREESHCERPVLSLFLACQEADVKNFISDPVARRRGFLGRTLVVRGRSLVGSRLAYDKRPEVGSSGLLPWAALVDVVTGQKPPSDSDGWVPLEIPITVEARELFSRLFEVVEKRLGEDSPDLQLDEMEDIVGRSLEQVGRLSILLHVLWTAPRRVLPTDEPISEATVFRAFALMLWALQGFLDLASPSPSGGHNAALDLWRAMNDSPIFDKGFATTKEWARLGPNRWRSAAKVEPQLLILEQLGYLSLSTKKNARGPSSRIIELNPSARHSPIETVATVATVCENPLFVEVIKAHPHLRRFASVCDGIDPDPIPSQETPYRRTDPCASKEPLKQGFAQSVATVATVATTNGHTARESRFPTYNAPEFIEVGDLY